MTGLPERVELLTDLYELTMAASYLENKMADPATFSLFIRKYPPNRGYFVAAGLEDALDHIANFHFSERDLAYLDSTGTFSEDFLHYLQNMVFTGDIRAWLRERFSLKMNRSLRSRPPLSKPRY